MEPFDTGTLAVGDGHVLHYEQVGRPDGAPVVYLHGGPGSGCGERARRWFDPTVHRAVLFDQRGAGRSTPHASEPDMHWGSIDLDHHVADIERLREHLGIDRWIVFGLSWGSVLGLAYAERHPECVRAVVIGAVSTSTRTDIDWIVEGCGRYFPERWEAFRDHVPLHLGDRRLLDAYAELVFDPDPAVHGPAAAAWCRWEDTHVAVTGPTPPADGYLDPRYHDPRFRLAFARQVTHCWRHDAWLEPDELVANIGRLHGIHGWIIHGRLDISAPLAGAWRLHHAWPGSELVVVDHEGHGGATMTEAWTAALREAALAATG